jgi:hypothetical protein
MTPVLLLALLATPPPDTLLVEVVFVQTQAQVVVEAILTRDSVLLLPARPVYLLLGLGPPPAAWTTPAALQAAYPTVTVAWYPRELRVVILDNLDVLPASRRATAQHLAATRFASALSVQSGPFAAVSWDGGRHALLDLGYNWRGRVALVGRADDAGAAVWTASVAPSSHLYLTYEDGLARPPTASARVALGPVWLSAQYVRPQSPVVLAGLVHIGPVQAFASSQFGVLSLQPAGQMAVTVAQVWATHRTSVRLSVGPVPASPFAVPVVALPH